MSELFVLVSTGAYGDYVSGAFKSEKDIINNLKNLDRSHFICIECWSGLQPKQKTEWGGKESISIYSFIELHSMEVSEDE